MDQLGCSRYCCRRMIMTHVDLIEKLLKYVHGILLHARSPAMQDMLSVWYLTARQIQPRGPRHEESRVGLDGHWKCETMGREAEAQAFDGGQKHSQRLYHT